MKRNTWLFALMALFLVAFSVIGCNREAEGVHGPDGVTGPQVTGPQMKAGNPPDNAIVIENSGELVTRTYDLADFEELEARFFDLEIRRGDAYEVTIEVEKNALDFIQVAVEDGRLKLGLAPDGTYHMVNVTMRARVTMPELVQILLDLDSEAKVTGFDCTGTLQKELKLGSSLTCGEGAGQVRFEADF